MQTITVPTITFAVWLICYLLKMWVADTQKRIIPTVAALAGLALGLATIGLSVDGALTGAISGLAATGANELFNQYRKDTEVDDDKDY